MHYQKYAFALLCSISLTSCWPASEENESTTKTTKSSNTPVRYIREENEFTRTIKQGNVVVDFYADWCGPCKRLGPVITDLAKEFADVKFVKVNVDNEGNISKHYGVRSIPTLVFFKNGNEVKKITGYKSKSDLRSILKSIF